MSAFPVPRRRGREEPGEHDRLGRLLHPPRDLPDHSSREGAEALAQRIETYWEGRITCRVADIGTQSKSRMPYFIVRSDLGPRGLPAAEGR